MLTFDNPETLTVDSARVNNFTIFFAGDAGMSGQTPPVVSVTVERGTQAMGKFEGRRKSTITIAPPASERIAAGAGSIVRALLEHMQSEKFLPSGTIQE